MELLQWSHVTLCISTLRSKCAAAAPFRGAAVCVTAHAAAPAVVV